MDMFLRFTPWRNLKCIFVSLKLKYWLEPVIELAQNKGFSTKELSFIEEILEKYGDEFKLKYQQHVGKRVDDK